MTERFKEQFTAQFFFASASLDLIYSLEIKTMKLAKAYCYGESSFWYIASLLKNASVKKILFFPLPKHCITVLQM